MDQFKHLAVADARQMLDKEEPVVVVDIRDPESFKQGRIIDALHLDNNGIADFIQANEFEVPIIVCCYHGNMSQQAAQFLVEQGFDDVYSLDGGYTEWVATYPDEIDP